MDLTSTPELAQSTVQKLTVTYDEREDRLFLAAQCEAGDTYGLWLTQRLANPLIKVLLTRLAETRDDSEPVEHQAVLQAWEQSAAKAQYQASEPVDVAPGSIRGLVDTVNVVCHVNGDFQLIFRWHEEQAIAFPITARSMRQWLGMLRQQYRRADWPSARVWPAWFEAAVEADQVPTVVH